MLLLGFVVLLIVVVIVGAIMVDRDNSKRAYKLLEPLYEEAIHGHEPDLEPIFPKWTEQGALKRALDVIDQHIAECDRRAADAHDMLRSQYSAELERKFTEEMSFRDGLAIAKQHILKAFEESHPDRAPR